MSVEEAVAASFQGEQDGAYVYRLGADFPAFNGHFPGQPILPAVCQISLSVDALSRRLGRPVDVQKIVRAKFVKPILPGTCVHVRLTDQGAGRFSAELISAADGGKCSQISFFVTFKETL